jgi:hypothetical protein
MSSFAGNLFDSGIVPGVSLNPAQGQRIASPFPFGAFVAGAVTAGEKTAKWAQDTVHLALTGARAHVFSDDWYYRIHITKTSLSLGNVVSDIVASIGIWNAWIDRSQTLDTFAGANDTGITVAAPGSTPLIFPPGAQFNYAFTITIDGPPTLDADYLWTFADGEVVGLNITGQRITAWAIRPDWSNGVKEKLSFLTDLLMAETGTEQRRKLRSTPRRTFAFDFLVNGSERRYMESALYAWTSMVWALPIWPDGQRLGTGAAIVTGATEILVDTTHRDYSAGGLGILVQDGSHYEVVQVDTVTDSTLTLVHPVSGNWPAGSRIYPARTARLDKSPQLSRSGAEWQGGNVSFLIIEPCTWSTVTGLPQYRGIDVLEILPDTDGAVDDYEREFQTIDGDTGIMTTDDTAGLGFPITGFNFWIRGAAQRDQMRAIFYKLAGKVGEMWVPTWKTDMVLASQVLDNAQELEIELIGYTLFINGQMGRRDVRIELYSGVIYYRRVLSSATDSTTTEHLALDAPFVTGFTPAQVRRISYMTLSRQINDEVTIDHDTTVAGTASAPTSFRGVNHDV